jgi:hypothetical protein
MSRAYKAGFEHLSQAADFIASASCSLSPEEKQTHIQRQIDLLPIHQGDVSGLRIDICLENAETGETKWIDTTAVHTTCATYETKNSRLLKGICLPQWPMYTLYLMLYSLILVRLYWREVAKVEKYSRLLMVAKKQHMDGTPKLHPIRCV